ncbi:MAG: hypothetical protein AB1725_05730 [Armatimonadota bacterium]
MDEVRRHDWKNLLIAAIQPPPLIALVAGWFTAYQLMALGGLFSVWGGLGLATAVAGSGYFAFETAKEWLRRRFVNPEYADLWRMIEDRFRRFQRAVHRAPSGIAGSFNEIARTVEHTKRRLYTSLRKADLVKKEILDSERGAGGLFPFPPLTSPDSETNDLYAIAAKNFEEYRTVFDAITSKVSRTEAQCAVYISALDSLRVQLLGHRLEKREAAMPKEEMDETVNDIRTQLDSINSALDELELRPGFLTAQREELEERLEDSQER